MLKPVITERSYALANRGWYTFMVESQMNKNKAKKLVEELFGVKVLKVKSMVVKGKTKRSLKTRKLIKTPTFKKIIVKLVGDQKIDLFEGATK